MECYIALSKEKKAEEEEFSVDFLPPAQNPTGESFVGKLEDRIAKKSLKKRGFSEIDGEGEEIKQPWAKIVKKDNDCVMNLGG